MTIQVMPLISLAMFLSVNGMPIPMIRSGRVYEGVVTPDGIEIKDDHGGTCVIPLEDGVMPTIWQEV